MNEEQMEAHNARLEEINERHNRANGWREGAAHETRRARLKRLRRWDRLPIHYPDSFLREGLSLVRHITLKGVELLVTSHQRPCMDIETIRKMTQSGYKTTHDEGWPQVEQFNGYCRFKRKPVQERGCHGLLDYAPVHGGITFACHQLGVSVYGFDTAHFQDHDNPLCKNLEWVEHQALVMAESVRIAAIYEPDYLRFNDRMARAEVIDRYHKHIHKAIGQPFDLQNNFGAMINAIFGQL